MVKVLRSLVRGPLEPHIVGFAEELFGGATRARRPSSMLTSRYRLTSSADLHGGARSWSDDDV